MVYWLTYSLHFSCSQFSELIKMVAIFPITHSTCKSSSHVKCLFKTPNSNPPKLHLKYHSSAKMKIYCPQWLFSFLLDFNPFYELSKWYQLNCKSDSTRQNFKGCSEKAKYSLGHCFLWYTDILIPHPSHSHHCMASKDLHPYRNGLSFSEQFFPLRLPMISIWNYYSPGYRR